jgi:hypothetical protein
MFEWQNPAQAIAGIFGEVAEPVVYNSVPTPLPLGIAIHLPLDKVEEPIIRNCHEAKDDVTQQISHLKHPRPVGFQEEGCLDKVVPHLPGQSTRVDYRHKRLHLTSRGILVTNQHAMLLCLLLEGANPRQVGIEALAQLERRDSPHIARYGKRIFVDYHEEQRELAFFTPNFREYFRYESLSVRGRHLPEDTLARENLVTMEFRSCTSSPESVRHDRLDLAGQSVPVPIPTGQTTENEVRSGGVGSTVVATVIKIEKVHEGKYYTKKKATGILEPPR